MPSPTLSTATLMATALLPIGLAAQSPVTVSAQLALKTDYLFAGIPFATGAVTQATVSVGASGLTVNGFAVYDHDTETVSEADLYGDYYAQLSPAVGVFAGAALYSFKIVDAWDSTPEVYAGVGFTAPLSPTLYVAHDFDLGNGTHATLLLSHSVSVSEAGATLTFGGSLDYNDGYYTAISGFSYADLGVALEIPVGPVLVTPLVVVQAGIDATFVDEEYFGLSASYTF